MTISHGVKLNFLLVNCSHICLKFEVQFFQALNIDTTSETPIVHVCTCRHTCTKHSHCFCLIELGTLLINEFKT